MTEQQTTSMEKVFTQQNWIKVAFMIGAEQIIPLLATYTTLRSVLGKESENVLKETFGERYEEVLKNIEQTKDSAAIVESYLKGVRAQTINKEDVSSQRFINYRRSCRMISLIQQDLIDAIFALLKKTDIKHIAPHHYLTKVSQRAIKNFYLITEEDRKKEPGAVEEMRPEE